MIQPFDPMTSADPHRTAQTHVRRCLLDPEAWHRSIGCKSPWMPDQAR